MCGMTTSPCTHTADARQAAELIRMLLARLDSADLLIEELGSAFQCEDADRALEIVVILRNFWKDIRSSILQLESISGCREAKARDALQSSRHNAGVPLALAQSLISRLPDC